LLSWKYIGYYQFSHLLQLQHALAVPLVTG